RRREVVIVRVPYWKIFVPITHDLVHAATVDHARQATNQLDEMTKGRGHRRPKLHVVDVAIQGLTQSVDKFCHAAISPSSELKMRTAQDRLETARAAPFPQSPPAPAPSAPGSSAGADSCRRNPPETRARPMRHPLS